MSNYINTNDDEIITPEALARKLLLDDEIENCSAILLPFVISDEKKEDSIYNRNACQFEILITIYMEMVFGILIINHINNHIDNNGNIDNTIDLDDTFNPDLTECDVNGMTDIFREKLKKVRVFLSVNEICDNDLYSDYYCKIVLKDTIDGKEYFEHNKARLDPKKRYTFLIRNDPAKKQNRLNDFYAICDLPNKRIRISFLILKN